MISWIDILLIALMGLAIWKGWKNGFVYELVMFLALFAAIYIAIRFSDWTASFLHDKMDMQSEYLPVASFGITFLLVMVGAWFLAKLVSGLVNAGGGETPNRIGGALFALGKAVFILSLFFLFVISFDSKHSLLSDEQRKKSMLLKPVYSFSLTILPAVKNSDFYKRLEEKKLILSSDTSGVAAGRP